MTNTGVQQSRDRLELEFLYPKKINVIPNFDLPLILTVTVVDRVMTGLLVDDESSCNILYIDIVELGCVMD